MQSLFFIKNRGPIFRMIRSFIVGPFVLCAIVVLLTNDAWGQVSVLEAEQVAFQQAGEFASPCVVQLEKFASLQGGEDLNSDAISGTIVASDGLVISSLSYFRDTPASITATISDGTRFSAKIVARDFSRELVLLKMDGAVDSLSVAQASDPKNWKIGQWVIALGKTFDPAIASRSVGILSAQGRIFDKAIQTDAKISPHNYGGPLVDLEGKVMGILTPMNPNIATEGEVQQWYDGGIGFAVPLNDILARLPRLKEGKDIHSGKVGFRPKAPDDFGGPVVLSGVTPGSPAAKVGLRSGDRLVKVAGKPVDKMNWLRHALGPMDAETTIKIEIDREGKPMSFDCELVKEVPLYREPYLGIYFGNAKSDPAPVVQGIIPGSPAAKAGLDVGDRVLSLQDQEIQDVAKLREQLAFLDYREPLSLRIKTAKEEKGVKLQATPWPREIPTDAAVTPIPVPFEGEGKGVVELPLGDVKNKAFAFTPANYSSKMSHGLLIVLPEAGEVNRKDWVDSWEPFCRDHHWVLVVLSSSDPKKWIIEENELIGRVRNLAMNDYSIDPSRVVLGGTGAGGTLAMIGGLQERGKVRGVWMVDSKVPISNRIQSAEPMESMHLLMIGNKPEYPKLQEAFQKLGFRASVLPVAVEVAKPNAGDHMIPLRRWLKSLEAI